VSQDAVDRVVDGLYDLEPGDFVRGRDAAARELRDAGLRAEAGRVKELRRPSVAAGAVNRLVRTHRSEVERFLSAAAELRQAQLEGRELEKRTQQERDALGRLVRAGGAKVLQSLRAAAVDEEAARQLLEARLERELEPRGFGTLLGDVPGAAPARGKPKARPASKKPDMRAERKRLDEARSALAEANARERQARDSLRAAEDEVRRAEGEVRRTEGAVAKAEERLAALEQATSATRKSS
jgi:hypothetical protein